MPAEVEISAPRHGTRRGRLACIQPVLALLVCRTAYAAPNATVWSEPSSVIFTASPASFVDLTETDIQRAGPQPPVSLAAPADAEPAAGWSASAIHLDIADGQPLAAHLGYRTADASPAEDAWDAGTTIADPFGTNQTVSCGVARRVDGTDARTTVSDLLPLAGGSTLRASAWLESRGDTGSGAAGHAAAGDLAYAWHGRTWESQVDVTLSGNDMGLGYGAMSFASGAVTQRELAIGCTAADHARGDATTIADRLVIGRAGVDTALMPATPSLTPWTYAYDRLVLTRAVTLPDGIVLSTGLCLQLAQGRLFTADQVDTADLAMAYPADGAAVPAREGIVLAERLTTPATDLGRLADGAGLAGDTIAGGVFWTYAALRQPDTGAQPADDEREAAAGFDIATRFLSTVALDLDLGWQKVQVADTSQSGPIGRFAVSFAF